MRACVLFARLSAFLVATFYYSMVASRVQYCCLFVHRTGLGRSRCGRRCRTRRVRRRGVCRNAGNVCSYPTLARARVAGLNLIINTIILRMHTISISFNCTVVSVSACHVLTEISTATRSAQRVECPFGSGSERARV